MDVLVGAATSLRVDFIGPMGSLNPDANSVTWSLYDSTGALLSGPTALTTLSTDTGVTIAIAATSNTIGVGRRFDKRLVIVSYASGGAAGQVRTDYRIIPLLPMTATADNVRTVIGCDSDELPDEEIDLLTAYLLLERDVGVTPLHTALSTGTFVELFANQAIVGQCVIELLSGMHQKLGVLNRNGTLTFQRFPSLDLQAVVLRARSLRSRGMAAILGLVETSPVLLVLSDPVDPVTDDSAVILSWP